MAKINDNLFSDEIVKNVKQSWRLVNGDLQSIGIAIFFRLFDKYPEYQSMFKAFNGVAREDLQKSTAFKRHALNVANSIETIVNNLNNEEVLLSILAELGTSHKKRRVAPQHFQNLISILTDTIRITLADNCTDAIYDSWCEVLEIALTTAAKGLI